jgi:hypothetical protein
VLLLFLISFSGKASYILLPMDETTQQNHLKAYGITYWCLDRSYKVNWLLNYRGGSFLLPDADEIRKECQIRGVSFEIISDAYAIYDADLESDAQLRLQDFQEKWQLLEPDAVRTFTKDVQLTFSFYQFDSDLHHHIRTTNTKTQRRGNR